MALPSPTSVRGDFADATFAHAGVTSRFSRAGERYVVRTDGADGALHEYAVAYTFGVAPLQQLLLPLGAGRLQALSIAWDTRPKSAGGQRWFHLYGSERVDASDPLHWTRPAQNWNHVCGDCHATGYRKRYDAATRTFDTRWAELGVGCEGCHGPASAHVAWTRTGAGERALPARLDERRGIRWSTQAETQLPLRSVPRTSEREIEVCAQCHARRASVDESYRAGDAFLDHYRPELLEAGLYFADGQQRDEVYAWGSFLQSRMYARGVTCSDCHEPHSGALRAEGSAVCATCHPAERYAAPAHHHHAAGSPGADCVACHMPTATYMQIDPRHDHSLRVPRPDLSVALGTPNACGACHAREGPAWAAERLRAWLGRDPKGYQGFAEALHAADVHALGAGARLRAVASDPAETPIARASALARLDASHSRAAFAALAAGLRDANALVRLGALLGLESAPPAARNLAAPLLSDPLRALRLEAARVLAEDADALQAGERAAFERAAAERVASLRLDADRAEARSALGAFFAQRGELARALVELEAAVALEPAFVAGRANLADAYRALGREAEAERTLREGLVLAPASAPLHHALGLALVRAERPDEALPELARAAALEPETARYRYVYAVALHSAGREAEAIAELERALDAQPGERATLEALIAFHEQAGRAEPAARYRAQLAALDAAEE